ncbi:uncharacterized protein [Aegilops tauschii subsp. strangulata]|uniref:uncharacterized protein n=1 Tax=Aegilops tauschii subsp. strangulata TaxID=200361 RepID=UPI003CC88976
MGCHWIPGRKGKHDREAGSSFGHRCRSTPSPPPPPPPPAFHIAPSATGSRSRPYVKVELCRRYWETRTSLPWTDVHLPNNWHLSADRMPIPTIPVSRRARREEINRRRACLPPDLIDDWRYAVDSLL